MQTVYRFADLVAINLDGQTVYLTPGNARKVSRAVNRVCREVEAGTSFTDSTVGSEQFDSSTDRFQQ